ncbi:acyltransferase family protein [Glaesserella sp.]|uniref:acyltransferase family protein n=1 Tax=Glaesserella sp. TaxID=2094731 RepID=UPI0035A18762
MSSIHYRADIDGLRAIAVLSVILFHINTAWLPGGFLGVDIFFVLSGYLITRIISKEMYEGSFSFIEFYKRRAKRILPVFVLVLFSTTLVTYFLLLKNDFIPYLKSALASLLFSANLLFARGGDYFDISTAERPLLHIWSLSVEEQFYFFFPILLLFCFKLFKNKIHLMIIGLIIISLLSQFLPSFGMERYYLPYIRAYELLIGSLFAFIPPRKVAKGIPTLLLIAIIAIMFIPRDTLPGNGYIERLIVCFSVGLLILFGHYSVQNKKDIAYTVLSTKVMVGIGLISYSLYLWHWVILALFRYVYMGNILPNNAVAVAVILMFVLAYFSYRFVENPIRRIKHLSNKQFIGGIAAYFMLLIPVALLYYQTSKIVNTNTRFTWDQKNACHDALLTEGCKKGDLEAPVTILVAGDSHAGQYNLFIDRVGKKEGWAADVITTNTCAVAIGFRLPNDHSLEDRCNTYNSYIENNLSKYQTVILIERWMIQIPQEGFLQHFEETIRTLLKNGKQVYVFKDNPMAPYPMLREYTLRQRGLDMNHMTEYRKQEIEKTVQANNVIKQLVDKYPEVHWVDLSAYFPESFMIDNYPIYRDYDHLNPYGVEKITSQFIENETLIRTH